MFEMSEHAPDVNDQPNEDQINAQKVTFENPHELLNVNTLKEFNGIAER